MIIPPVRCRMGWGASPLMRIDGARSLGRTFAHVPVAFRGVGQLTPAPGLHCLESNGMWPTGHRSVPELTPILEMILRTCDPDEDGPIRQCSNQKNHRHRTMEM